MRGIYKCKKCRLILNVISTSANPYSRIVKVKIPSCPHCHGKIVESDINEFDKIKPIMFLELKRKYAYKHIGERIITMLVKFYE